MRPPLQEMKRPRSLLSDVLSPSRHIPLTSLLPTSTWILDLPASLQLARTLNEQPLPALQQLESQSKDLWPILKPVLPYLTLPTLLLLASRPSCAALFPTEATDEIKSRTLSETLDFQRDWLVEECPPALRDEYLVSAFEGEGAAWASLQQEGVFQLKMPDGCEMVVESAETTVKGEPRTRLQQFQSKLKEVSGGLFEKLDWSDVCLGGGEPFARLLTVLCDDF
ncbi:hypothetical protein BCR35DRAFT_79526 [Leucosporidium creatinivorum]|uniref:Uncharacterized protein n=1 Tax=Leucosporidium creatinivorum TaxID=106004 RepID=A0A1Y2FH78_9BASI|nr:hypothetical protein BCR35DRAFT_79526 [Leucosporidium creatinivorum]